MTEKRQRIYAVTLWYKPIQTMQGLIRAGKGHGWAVVIAGLFGMVQGGRFYIGTEEGSVSILLLGALIGVLALFLFGWLLRNFSRWFGASPTMEAVRTAVGLSLLPWTLLFAALVWRMGVESDAGAISGFFPVFFAVFIYGYVILLLSLTAVLRISILKTFLCLVVTILVSFFPITLLLQVLVGTPPLAP